MPIKIPNIQYHQWDYAIRITLIPPKRIEGGILTNGYNVSEIYLEYLHITDLSTQAFDSLYHLRALHLVGNDLNTIQDRVISNLQSLEYLDLSINKIQNISKYSFKNTTNLKMLNLSSNLLTSFDLYSINSINRIVIDLSFNNISTFQFEDVTLMIEALNLSHNSLSEINDCFPTYKIIDLSNNNLKSIPSVSCSSISVDNVDLNLGSNFLLELKTELFVKMENLEKLFLDQNNLTSLPSEIFSGMHSLKVLNISHNELQQVQSELFDNLEKLSVLDISYNKLTYIGDSLASLKCLQDLRIHFNQLKTLSYQQLFLDLPKLNYFSLDCNEFLCQDPFNHLRYLSGTANITIQYELSTSINRIPNIMCYIRKNYSGKLDNNESRLLEESEDNSSTTNSSGYIISITKNHLSIFILVAAVLFVILCCLFIIVFIMYLKFYRLGTHIIDGIELTEN